MTEEVIKEMINREYAFYFKRNNKIDIYEDQKSLIPRMNGLN